jgi:hypothetical protein
MKLVTTDGKTQPLKPAGWEHFGDEVAKTESGGRNNDSPACNALDTRAKGSEPLRTARGKLRNGLFATVVSPCCT